ncbi:uncharacterized protein LOC132700832 [Cylas formicarius]|uniref:uncharacterized protein LOC132700832 n=1 Tax=Cylas formicarius TaxID=197179 RepID=UPI002958C343|nr:uncharacterized protein LOC132700832 [Cylas formicarius]
MAWRDNIVAKCSQKVFVIAGQSLPNLLADYRGLCVLYLVYALGTPLIFSAWHLIEVYRIFTHLEQDLTTTLWLWTSLNLAAANCTKILYTAVLKRRLVVVLYKRIRHVEDKLNYKLNTRVDYDESSLKVSVILLVVVSVLTQASSLYSYDTVSARTVLCSTVQMAFLDLGVLQLILLIWPIKYIGACFNASIREAERDFEELALHLIVHEDICDLVDVVHDTFHTPVVFLMSYYVVEGCYASCMLYQSFLAAKWVRVGAVALRALSDTVSFQFIRGESTIE